MELELRKKPKLCMDVAVLKAATGGRLQGAAFEPQLRENREMLNKF